MRNHEYKFIVNAKIGDKNKGVEISTCTLGKGHRAVMVGTTPRLVLEDTSAHNHDQNVGGLRVFEEETWSFVLLEEVLRHGSPRGLCAHVEPRGALWRENPRRPCGEGRLIPY
jgi:hypothetical protein